jgi:hypothetical protein
LSAAPDLLRILHQLYRGNRELRLLNLYKGLPILYVSKIDTLLAETIEVPASKQQLACLFHQKETYLQSDAFPGSIRARVTDLDLSLGRARLSNFSSAETGIGERMRVRVEPNEAPLAYLRFHSGYHMPAPLVDISPEGVSITVHDTRYAERYFNISTLLELSLSFPKSVSRHIIKVNTRPLVRHVKTPDFVATRTHGPRLPKEMWRDGVVVVNTRGQITSHAYNQSQELHRIGIRLSSEEIERSVIAQYIAYRQAEIIRDLRMLADDLYYGRIE